MRTTTMTKVASAGDALLSQPAANDVLGRAPRAAEVTAEELELVRRIAGAILRRLPAHIDRDELIALGNLGLVEAKARFDASRGVPFSGFAAPRIRGAILDGLRSADPLTREERARVRSGEEAVPSVMLTELVGDVEATEHVPADARIEHHQQLAELRAAVARLGERERFVITRHFIDGQPLKAVGVELGVTESRVCQIVSEAVAKMRSAMDIEVRPSARTGRPKKAPVAAAMPRTARRAHNLWSAELPPLAAALRTLENYVEVC